MKTFLKILKYFAVVLACIIALSYTFGYDYLFKGVAKTYLRGETSATIDDGKLFPKHIILAENPKPWIKDALYNKKALPKNLVEDLKNSKSVSFLVIKNGKLLHEQYWEGYTEKSSSNSFSIAKTVTSLLLGAVIDDERIKSENQLFSDYYEQFGYDNFRKNLTLKNLVTMEAGLDWDEQYSSPFTPNAKAYYGNSLANAVLDVKVKQMPGKNFEYQSGSTQLLGFALRKAVAMPIASYASKKLWNPLGMEQNAYWTTDEMGVEKTFCCIHSNSRDFAKLGQLMLNDGKVDSLQVINKNYIQKMITPTQNSTGTYGYGMWINNDAKYKHYFFWGILGQYIIVVPEKQLVIVRTGRSQGQTSDSKGRPSQVEFLVNEVVNNF